MPNETSPQVIFPLDLHSSGTSPDLWWVVDGGVDVFLEIVTERGSPYRRYAFSLHGGEALFGLPTFDGGRWLATAQGGAEVRRESWTPDRATAPQVSALETWIERLAAALDRLHGGVDFIDRKIATGQRITLGADERLAASGGVVWIRPNAAEALGYGDHETWVEGACLPLTQRAWAEAKGSVKIESLTTADVLTTAGPAALDTYHALVTRHMAKHLLEHYGDEQRRLSKKATFLAQDRREILWRFSSVIDRQRSIDRGAPPLLAACQRIGAFLGVKVREPEGKPGASMAARIEIISRRSRLRTRQVLLRGQWWKRDASPMLAFARADGQPLVLLPGDGERRVWFPDSDPQDPGEPIDAELASQIDPVAFSFYRTLPDRPLRSMDLLRFATSLGGKDILHALILSVAVTFMTLLVPIAFGLVIDVTIPSNQPGQLVFVAIALVVAALAAFGFQVARDVAVLRLQGKMAEAMQPAILDRLLRMPNTFFRRYSAGDLAERVRSLDAVETRLGDGALSTLLTAFSSLFNLLLLFYIHPPSALVATALLLGLVLALLYTVQRQVSCWTEISRIEGRLSSFLLDMVGGIHRIRLAGAEDRFFVRWGQLSMAFRDVLTETYTREVRFNSVARGYNIASLAIVFGTVAWFQHQGGGLSTGEFLAFVTAFAMTLGGFVHMAESMLPLVELVPMFRRVQPILGSMPESEEHKVHPGVLSGHLEIHELVFRYEDSMRNVLDGISLEIEAGESVALVGASGCGKSTLFRLILGFELPTAGGIYFDGKDLATLDLREVRHQIGVVLQQDKLMEATIFENIRGDNDITTEQAWEAARMCGIAKDIEAMPLGMHTVISAEGADLSGGQVQRLLIARALAARPRILLLDEATSALDNHTQSVVTESLDRMRVTRIAIAHRLSTVKNADKIIVLRHGRVAESGSYEALMAKNDYFAELVNRQLTRETEPQ